MNRILNNWSVCVLDFQPYQPPECQKQGLHGNVSNHPGFDEDAEITTTSIKGQRGGLVVTNSGGLYELGTIDPQYEATFPDARSRLFSTLPEVAA